MSTDDVIISAVTPQRTIELRVKMKYTKLKDMGISGCNYKEWLHKYIARQA